MRKENKQMVFTQKGSITVSNFFSNDDCFNLHLPMADDETEIIVRQDDCKPCIFLHGTINNTGIFKRYMDCIVYNYMVNLDSNRLIIWIEGGEKKWSDC